MVSENLLEISPIIGHSNSMFTDFEKASDLVERPQKCVDRLSSPCRGTHYLLLFTDASVKGCGAHLGDLTVCGMRSVAETSLFTNILELKAVFVYLGFYVAFNTVQVISRRVLKAVCLALKALQSDLQNKRVLFASNNATVVSYLNKQGGGPLLRNVSGGLMAFYNPRAILLRACHIEGCLSLIADILFGREKIIHTEWLLHPKVFLVVYKVWRKPMAEMFATKLNKKTTSKHFTSPRLQCNGSRCIQYLVASTRRLCLLSSSFHSKTDTKMRIYACHMIVVAPGWPGMNWFWDLIDLSTKPPLLPYWETPLRQPFSQRFQQNLPYLNLHVWHVDSRPNYLKNSQSVADRTRPSASENRCKLYPP